MFSYQPFAISGFFRKSFFSFSIYTRCKSSWGKNLEKRMCKHHRGINKLEQRREFCVVRDWSFYLVSRWQKKSSLKRHFLLLFKFLQKEGTILYQIG